MTKVFRLTMGTPTPYSALQSKYKLKLGAIEARNIELEQQAVPTIKALRRHYMRGLT